jgi:hypothetical protein
MITAGTGRKVVRMRFMRPGVVSGMLGFRVGIRLVIMGAAMIVRIVNRMLDMFGRGPARLAEEGKEYEPPAVEARQ